MEHFPLPDLEGHIFDKSIALYTVFQLPAILRVETQ